MSVAGLVQVVVELGDFLPKKSGNGANFSFLRVFRVLRPLRSLSHFSGASPRAHDTTK